MSSGAGVPIKLLFKETAKLKNVHQKLHADLKSETYIDQMYSYHRINWMAFNDSDIQTLINAI